MSVGERPSHNLQPYGLALSLALYHNLHSATRIQTPNLSSTHTQTSIPAPIQTLLAVDLVLRTGLAFFGGDGRLQWYRSQHFGSRSRLRRGAYGVLREADDPDHLVLEGGGDLADLWVHEASKRGVRSHCLDAHTWRERLLYPREHRTAADAKASADALARRIIAWSGADAPTSLRHDAAEAICTGLYAVLRLGWLERVPEEVKRRS